MVRRQQIDWKQRPAIRHLVLALLASTTVACGSTDQIQPRVSVPPVPRIAHAGGGYEGQTYTNSIEALKANSHRYQFFEIDFLITADSALVCLHDWESSSEEAFGRRFTVPPTAAEFDSMTAANPRYTNCTGASLRQWMMENPGAVVVTDVKDDNLRALALIRQQLPDADTRVIPQIYTPDEFERVRAMGFRRIILTLYRMRGSPRELAEAARRFEYFAVTMPKKRAGQLLPLLHNTPIPVYVHTVNREEEWVALRRLGATEIYSDWLPAVHVSDAQGTP
jgi:glycerophosphoryl diester phosphodiesterase